MTRLNWGMIGGGEGSQIGPAHRLGALADGHFNLVAGALYKPVLHHVVDYRHSRVFCDVGHVAHIFLGDAVADPQHTKVIPEARL